MPVRLACPFGRTLLSFAVAAVVGLSACGGGGGGGGNGGSDGGGVVDPPADDSPFARTQDHPMLAVNVLEDGNGASTVAVNSDVGEAFYLIHDGRNPTADNLVGVIYQSPDGRAAKLQMNENGLPTSLETDDVDLTYSNYTADTVDVTATWRDGRQQVFRNMPIESLMAARDTMKFDRHDVGFAIGFVGTAASIAFCVLPSGTGVGSLITVACANALLGSVGTAIGDASIGAGSSAIDLISGFATGDYSNIATGLAGAVSGLLGWESKQETLMIALSGLVLDRSTAGRLTTDGAPAEAFAIFKKPGSNSELRQALKPNGGFQVPGLLGDGAYAVRVEADGYLTEHYTMAISGDRARIARDADTPDESGEVLYDFTYNDVSKPAVIFLDVQLERAPKIYGKVIWPRRNSELGEAIEIVDGGMVGLYDSAGNKVAFHTIDFVESTSTVHGGEQIAGGDYELYLPEKHGNFVLEYSGTHWETQRLQVVADRATEIRIDVPETGHMPAETKYYAFSSGSNASTNLPVASTYDGRWTVTLVPSIPSYTYTYEYQDAEGDTVTEEITQVCEQYVAIVDLDGGAGIAQLDGDEDAVAIGQKGEFVGRSWWVAWEGTIYNGGAYWEERYDERGCYGTFSTSKS